MDYPELTVIPRSRETVDTFRGCNRNLRIGAGEFRYMENLTGDHYPVLSPRGRRQVYAAPQSPQGLIAKEKLCYVDGADFVIGEDRYALGLSTGADRCPKQLISMGAYVIILPDKRYINTADPTDFGSLDAEVTVDTLKLKLCRDDGTALTPDYTQSATPASPENGELWLDTSLTPGSLKQWSDTAAMWQSVASTYVRLEAPGIGSPFRQWDGVRLTGFAGALSSFNTSAVLYAAGEDFLVVAGLLPQPEAEAETAITVSRKSPEMDFVVECGNRLWGCRFGPDENGEAVNRLYASKLGDFKNWNCYLGVSTDSYYVNLGSDGAFTGAASHLGTPLFFKENCLHKVYGSFPAEFSVQDTPCRGVQPGCHRSLAIVGDVLYYKSRSSVCAYDGSLPREVSYALGQEPFRDAVAGAHGNKYVISMAGENGHHLYVYDTVRSFWHRQDDFMASGFASQGGRLYAVDARSLNILILEGAPEPDEEKVMWMADTGELGLTSPDRKYISRITLRLSMEMGSYMDVYAKYDQSDTWEHLCHVRATSLRSFSVPIRPRRCDFLQLRLKGAGDMKLYGLTKTIEKGSDLL